jgi:hypothetical protein
MAEDEIDESEFGQVGWYNLAEVKRLFEGFEAGGYDSILKRRKKEFPESIR